MIKRFPDEDSLSEAFIRELQSLARQSIADRGTFHLGLSGGSQPAMILRNASLLWEDAQMDYSRWIVYPVDERCSNSNSDEEVEVNFSGIYKLLERLPCRLVRCCSNNDSFTAIPAEEACQIANDALDKYCPDGILDLVVLGLGPDGHTASLFPPAQPLISDKGYRVIYHSPKPPPTRISMTYGLLSKARRRAFLVTGGGKAEAVWRILSQRDTLLPPTHLPPSEWWIDEAAGALMGKN